MERQVSKVERDGKQKTGNPYTSRWKAAVPTVITDRTAVSSSLLAVSTTSQYQHLPSYALCRNSISFEVTYCIAPDLAEVLSEGRTAPSPLKAP
jgi:hypothetical protein